MGIHPLKLEAFDVETWGSGDLYALQPFRALTGEAWLTSCAMARYVETGGVIDTKPHIDRYREPGKEMLRHWLTRCAAEGKYVVAWNAPFDVAWLIALGLRDEVFACNWLDGMLVQRHALNEPRFRPGGRVSMGLKETVKRHWPNLADYDANVTFNPQTEEEWAELLHYNGLDSSHTLRLTVKFLRRLSQAQLRSMLIEARSIPLVAESIVQGLDVNTEAAAELDVALERTAAGTFAAMRLLYPEVTDKVLASPKQLGELLFKTWGLPVVKLTDKGAPSTDRESLTELALVDERAGMVNTYREASNNRTKFAQGALNSAAYNGDGRTRPQARIFGTYSGRMTYSSKVGRGEAEQPSGVAIHQWKRDADFRRIISVPEGYTLLEFDFAGQEFRWMAVESGDPTMLQLCRPGEDAHAFMGGRCTGKAYTWMRDHTDEAKPFRQLGKVANLCIAEGTTILTDRGPCNIEHVKRNDKVWDGEAFVSHDGVTFSGYLPVMTHQGVTSTPDHKVLVRGEWVRNDEAARHGWTIEPALGAGRQSAVRSAVRIVDGLVRRAVSEVRRAVCEGSVRLWNRARHELADAGDRALDPLQGVRDTGSPCETGPRGRVFGRRAAHPEARERLVPEMPEPRGQVVAELRWAGDRVPVCNGEGGDGVRSTAPAAPHLRRPGHRPAGQQGSLRAWKLALGLSQGEPRQPSKARCYDIVNCGPNHRFAANGVIVHNSLQYRTSAKTLVRVAKVQHKVLLTETEAQAIWSTYRMTYRNVPKYWKRQEQKARTYGWIETLAGRRINLGEPHTWVYRDPELGEDVNADWSHVSAAINFPIQGIGADQKYLAMLVLRDYLPKVDGRFYFELHDGLFVVVPDHHADRAVVEIRHLLSNLPYKKAWGIDFPIQFPVDAKRGKTWGDLKEVKE